GHSPSRHGTSSAHSQLRCAHQFLNLRSGLSAQRGSGTARVGYSGNEYLLDVEMIRVLEKDYRRVDIFRQLISCDRNPTHVFEGAEKLKLVAVEDCDTRSSRIHLHHQCGPLTLRRA